MSDPCRKHGRCGCIASACCERCPLIVCRDDIAGGLPMAITLTRIAPMVAAGMEEAEIMRQMGRGRAAVGDAIRIGVRSGIFARARDFVPVCPFVAWHGLQLKPDVAARAAAVLTEAERAGCTLGRLRKLDNRRGVSAVRSWAMGALYEAGLTWMQVGFVLKRDHSTCIFGARRAAVDPAAAASAIMAAG